MCGGELVVGFFVGPCCACLCAGLLGEFAVRGRDLPGQFRVVARVVIDLRFRDGDVVVRSASASSAAAAFSSALCSAFSAAATSIAAAAIASSSTTKLSSVVSDT